jgi:hypothetical protein
MQNVESHLSSLVRGLYKQPSVTQERMMQHASPRAFIILKACFTGELCETLIIINHLISLSNHQQAGKEHTGAACKQALTAAAPGCPGKAVKSGRHLMLPRGASSSGGAAHVHDPGCYMQLCDSM